MTTTSPLYAAADPPMRLDLPLSADRAGVEANFEAGIAVGEGPGGADVAYIRMEEGVNALSIVYDLEALGINPRDFDEVHVHARHAGSDILFTPRLTGYPAKGLKRSWYSKTRLPQDEWYVWRFDLNLDDDGWQRRDRTRLDMNELKLYMNFSKEFRRTPGEPAWRDVWIERISLVRVPVSVSFEEIDAEPINDGGRVGWRYALNVQNRLAEAAQVNLRLAADGLEHFEAEWTERVLDLGPRQRVTVELALTMPAERAEGLPSLYAERVQVFAGLTGSDAPEATPLLGYRPQYIWAVTLPKEMVDPATMGRRRGGDDVVARADAALKVTWGVPMHGPEIHPQSYRDPETGHDPQALSWFRHRNPGTGEIYDMPRGMHHLLTDNFDRRTLKEFKDMRQVYAFVGQAHVNNFRRAELLADAYLETGQRRYAEAARDMFLEYARLYKHLPTQWVESTSGTSRLGHNTLMTAFRFEGIARAYGKIRASEVLSDDDRQAIDEGLFLPEVRAMYRHNVGFSNMQVHHYQSYAAGLFAMQGHWNLLGDALYGDHGFYAMIENSFTEDGIAHEAGVYHWFLLKPMVEFAEMMERHGVAMADLRFKRVFDGMVANSPQGVYGDSQAWGTFRFAFRNFRDPAYVPTLQAAGHWPLPGLDEAEIQKAEQEAERAIEALKRRNTNLASSGYLWLRDTSPRGFRALSVNYIMQWDRMEFDRLHFSLYAPHRVTEEVGRISYGSRYVRMMYSTLGHQSVVINRQNQRPEPSTLAAFLDRDELPAALITENPASPIYPGFEVARALAILDGVFFVGDIVHSRDGGQHTFDWPYYPVWLTFERDPDSGNPQLPLDLQPLPEPLGDDERTAYGFVTDAKGARSNEAVTAMIDVSAFRGREASRTYVNFAPMDDALFVSARAPRMSRPRQGPMMVVRQDNRPTAAWGVAIDATKPGAENAVRSVQRVGVVDGGGDAVPDHRAAAWRVETEDGRYLVVINRSGEPVRAEGIETGEPLAVERLP